MSRGPADCRCTYCTYLQLRLCASSGRRCFSASHLGEHNRVRERSSVFSIHISTWTVSLQCKLAILQVAHTKKPSFFFPLAHLPFILTMELAQTCSTETGTVLTASGGMSCYHVCESLYSTGRPFRIQLTGLLPTIKLSRWYHNHLRVLHLTAIGDMSCRQNLAICVLRYRLVGRLTG